jgi:uncharacterized membrane protein
MSLPSSERLPSEINELPPARQRHIRRQPRSASIAERQLLVDSLIKLTAPTPSFFLRTLLGALATGGALYMNNPAILIIAIVALPFNAPLFGLALYPITLRGKHALNSAISLLILLMFTFGAGALAGWLQPPPFIDRLSLYHFSALYWLYLVILGASSLLSVLVLLRQGHLPGGMGVLLAYTQLLPFTVVGFGLTNGQLQLWTGALFVSLTHLGLGFIMAMIGFLILDFPPRKIWGWLLGILALMVTATLIAISLIYAMDQTPQIEVTSPSPTYIAISAHTPSLTESSVNSPTFMPTSPTPTGTFTTSPTPTDKPTATVTPTPEPTSYWGVVDTALGAIIRENPSTDAQIVTYTNNADLIEILGEETAPNGSRWFNVRTTTGEVGWLLGSLLATQTPTP